jgi:hypothetical protein
LPNRRLPPHTYALTIPKVRDLVWKKREDGWKLPKPQKFKGRKHLNNTRNFLRKKDNAMS